MVRVVPKKTTEVPMITTRLTTLHTPCDTGLTRDNVLNANCAAPNTSTPGLLTHQKSLTAKHKRVSAPDR